MLKCIAIDDEPLALRQLRQYASQVDQIDLIATFRSAVEAKVFLDERRDKRACEGVDEIDLIFCDINMPEVSGVDFVRDMQGDGTVSTLPMVIFTTAYAEYAVEGFRLDAVDYLLKPFSQSDFERSVRRASSLHELRRGQISQADGVVEDVADGEHATEYLSVRADYKVTMVKLTDIIYMESEGEYVRMHIEGRRPITTLFRLKNMEAQLPSSLFVRIHRSYIINISRVCSYDKSRVYISKDEYLPIGQNYRTNFLQQVSQHFKGLE